MADQCGQGEENWPDCGRWKSTPADTGNPQLEPLNERFSKLFVLVTSPLCCCRRRMAGQLAGGLAGEPPQAVLCRDPV